MSVFKRISNLIMPLLLFLWWVLLPACGPEGTVPKKITVATDATMVPMSFMNDQGAIDGFDRALMEAVAKEAGLELEMVNVEWAGLLGGLITGKYDAAKATPKRISDIAAYVAMSVVLTPYRM